MKNAVIHKNSDIINSKLIFYSFNDFFYKKKNIKEYYKKLSITEKRIYKMYVYSLCWENEHAKDLIWEYLNSVDYTELGIYKEWGERQRRKKGVKK